MKPIQVLRQSSVSYLSVTEVLLHNEKSVLDLTTYREFLVLNPFIPVNAGITICHFQLGGAAVDTVINGRLVLVLLNLWPSGQPQIAGISVDDIIVLTDEFMGNIHIVDIGRSDLNAVNEAGSGIYTNMGFHTEIPLVSFFDLVHFGIAFLLFVLCGVGCCNETGIDNSAAAVNEPGLVESGFQRIE